MKPQLTGFSNGDFDNNNVINIDDWGVLAQYWGMILPEQPTAPNELIATGATGYNAIAVSWTQPVWGHSGYEARAVELASAGRSLPAPVRSAEPPKLKVRR